MRAVLRFVPAFDAHMLDDPRLARERMLQRGAIEQVSPGQAIPVVVDHDLSRRVGSVREIYVAPEVSGGIARQWFYASVDIDTPPEWLRCGGGVSWSYVPLQTQAIGETTRILRALIEEISVLSPSTLPGEPLARVAWIGEPSSPAAGAVNSSGRASSPAKPSDEYRPRVWDELEQKVGYAITDDNFERALVEARRSPVDRMYDEHVASRVPATGLLVRPGIGQVLGVR